MKFPNKWQRLRHSLKRKIEATLNVNIVSKGRSSHGICLFDDLNKFGIHPNTILDVGANVGQFAYQVVENCSDAALHCFEPEPNAYSQLKKNITHGNVTFSDFALGEKPSTEVLYVTGGTTNSLLRKANAKHETTVQVSTVDEYLTTHSIAKVDLLKIDTEGFEMQVLKGSDKSLAAGKISAIFAEVGFDSSDSRHVAIDEIRDFLMPYGFRITGLYEQSPEWSGEPKLEFCNLLLVKEV